MTNDLVVLPRAQRDVEEISDYLFVNASWHVSERFVEQVHEAIELLRDQPTAGAIADLPECPNVRIWGIAGFPSHLIYYRPTTLAIEVLRVMHSARNRDRLFEPPPA